MLLRFIIPSFGFVCYIISYPVIQNHAEDEGEAILLTVLIQDNNHDVLFMDEPEISLHVEWQQRLRSEILL